MKKKVKKKAEMNMWWVIMGAVLIMVIVIILLVIFRGGAEKGQSGLLGCLSKGGSCETLDACLREGGTISETFECPKSDQLCCFKEG